MEEALSILNWLPAIPLVIGLLLIVYGFLRRSMWPKVYGFVTMMLGGIVAIVAKSILDIFA